MLILAMGFLAGKSPEFRSQPYHKKNGRFSRLVNRSGGIQPEPNARRPPEDARGKV